ncbi:MAG TPA: DUF4038 domain-containing protein, partial [Patescibacteria group bacterium]|nr:DUF4038 domain-containing protein [Patescibacteria group bacterium]
MKLASTFILFAFAAQNLLAGVLYPLKVSTAQHYLVDQNNSPVFIHADSPWSMIVQLNIVDAETYLSNRANLQVNAVIANLIEHKFCANPPFNIYGVGPFTNKINGLYWDFSSINPDYFTNADNQIRLAGKYGITVFLDPDFLGVNGGDAGWYSDLNNNSSNTLFSFGQYLGSRYSAFTNIVWLHAGDYIAGNANNLVNAIAQGIASTDTNHLQLAEGFQSPGFNFTGSWNVINTVYEYTIAKIPPDDDSEYTGNPVSPFVLIESNYEGEDNSGMGHLATAHDCRNQAYYSAFSGSSGEFFGNHWIWQFTSAWQTQQMTSTSMTLTNLPALFASRPWYACIPDKTHTAVTAGFGIQGQNTYCPALRHVSGATLMAYIPGNSGSTVTLTTDLTKMSGTTANGWWYSPVDGTAISIGTFATTGLQNFTSPDAGEWVLLLDDTAQNFSPPGFAIPTPPTVSFFGASPSLITVGGASTLSWLVFGNPAPSLFVSPGIGPVSGSSFSVSPLATTIYTLTATNINGTALAQTMVTVTNDTSPPSSPLNVAVTFASATQINLAWTASTDDVGVAGYQVFRNGSLVGTSSGTFYSDTGLAPSTTYTYTVVAFDVAGNFSPTSNPVTSTTSAQIFKPALVQSGGNTDTAAGTTLAQIFSSTNTAGNLIAVVTAWSNSAATPMLSDSAGNTYVLAVSTYSSVANQAQAIYYARNIKPGSNTVTVNFGASRPCRRMLITEYRGVDPTNP